VREREDANRTREAGDSVLVKTEKSEVRADGFSFLICNCRSMENLPSPVSDKAMNTIQYSAALNQSSPSCTLV